MTGLIGMRPMVRDDVPRIAELDRVSYPYPWTAGNFSDALEAGNRCCLYEEHGEIVAYAVMMQVVDELHLLNLTVAPAWQGLGYGRAMLERLLEWAREDEFTSVWLEVRPSNQVARCLYTSAGFVEVGLRKNYYPAPEGREHALLMCLDIRKS